MILLPQRQYGLFSQSGALDLDVNGLGPASARAPFASRHKSLHRESAYLTLFLPGVNCRANLGRLRFFLPAMQAGCSPWASLRSHPCSRSHPF